MRGNVILATRQSILIYSETRSARGSSQSLDGEVLFRSDHGIPILWVFAFGGRNIWNPGDDVSSRGGAVGKRNAHETMVEVALARLEHAESVITEAPYLEPWLAGMPILRRKLIPKSKSGFIRIVAPWLTAMPKQDFERWRSATSFAENTVNLIAGGREAEALRSLEELRPFSSFVPRGIPRDLQEALKSRLYNDQDDVLRVALLTLGEPESRESFEKAARKEIGEALEKYRKLPDRKPPEAQLPAGSAAQGTARGESKPLLGRIAAIFRKK